MEHIYHQPQFGENWFTYPNLYSEMVKKASDRSKFVEVGSWKGKSSAYMAVEIVNSKKYIEFTCVDTWAGGVEHKDVNPEELYNTFIANMRGFNYKHLRMLSVEASKHFEDRSLDFVFIDASHEYEDVKADIIAWLPKVKYGGVLAGHDYYTLEQGNYYPGVVKAVNECLSRFKLSENCWIYYNDY